jgi:hypothetical protein
MSLDPVTAVIDLIKSGIDKAFPDATQKAAALAAIDATKESDDFQLALGQIGVNQTEATSPHFFVAGARPALLWVCVLSFAYHFVVWPFGVLFFPLLHDLDAASLAVLIPVLLTLIGARTYEKMQDVATSSFGGSK